MLRKIFLIAIIATLLCSVSAMALAQCMPIDNRTYVEDIMNQLMTGKIIELPGGHLVNYSSNGTIINSMNNQKIVDSSQIGIVACFQRFGYSNWYPEIHTDWPRTGRIWASINDINNLPSDGTVYSVIHQDNESWDEQAIILSHQGNNAEFYIWCREINGASSFAQCTDSDMGGMLTDTYVAAIVAVNDQGSINYSQVRYYIWDLNTNESCQYQCTLPFTSKLGWVDGSLEASNVIQDANNVHYVLNDLSAYDYNLNPLSLPNYYNIIEINDTLGADHLIYNRYDDPIYQQKPDGSYNATLVQWEEPDFGQGQYWKFINISGSQDGVLTDYQVKLTIHKGVGTDDETNVYLDDKSLSWPYDIRFTNGTKTDIANSKLSYWIESNDANTATVWVKVDYIAAGSATTQIKMFYGRPNDTGESNGPATFVFFDDFNGASLDTSKWGTTGSGYYSLSSGAITLKQTGSGAYAIDTTSAWGMGYGFRIRAKTSTTTQESMLGWCDGSMSNEASIEYAYGSTSIVPRNKQNGIYVRGSAFSSDKANYHIFDGKRRPISSATDFTVDDGNGEAITARVPTGNLGIRLGNWPTGGGTSTYDWVAIYKYTPNQPGQSQNLLKSIIISTDMPVDHADNKRNNTSITTNKTTP